MMKWLKRWIIAFFVGQFLALSKKDPAFKKQIARKQWRDKITFILDSIFNFNKELVHDTTEYFDAETLQTKIDQWSAWVKEEYDHLKWVILTYADSTKDQIEDIRDKLQTRFEHLMEAGSAAKDDLEEEFHREEKIKELKKLLADLDKKFIQSKK